MKVQGEGPINPDFIIVGEAPGFDEERAGRPFVGQSGRLLDELLLRAGINRARCYVTNVIKERPPNNDITSYVRQTSKGIETCPEWDRLVHELWLELRGVVPNADCMPVITLGNVPLYAMAQHWGVTDRRGSAYINGPWIVLPTLHPASALRQHINTHLIRFDLTKAAQLRAAGCKGITPIRNLHLNPSLKQALEYIESCRNFSYIGFDIETTIQRVRGSKHSRDMVVLSLAKSPMDAIAIPLVNLENNTHMYSPEDEVRLMVAVKGLLECPTVTKVGHNCASFDIPFFYHRYGIVTYPYEDTMLAQQVYMPDLPKSLAFTTSTWSWQPYYKDEGKAFKSGDKDYGVERFLRYAALDAALTLEIWGRQRVALEKQGNIESYQNQRDCLYPLLEMQARGWAIDLPARTTLARRVSREVKEVQTRLNGLAASQRAKSDAAWASKRLQLMEEIAQAQAKGRGVKGKEAKLAALTELNVKSPKALIEYFESCGATIPTVMGKKTVDKIAMRKLVSKGVPGAKEVSEIAQLRDDYVKYYTVPLDHDKRLRCQFKLSGTKSGRFSCARSLFGTGANFQNQPSRMKALMVADPGEIIINIDLSQAENRIVAWLAREPRLMEAFRQGLDVHTLTAALIFNKRPEDVSREKGSCSLGDGKHSERDWGKRANHALGYGMGPFLLAYQYEMPIKDGKFIHGGYHAAYPAISKVFWQEVRTSIYETSKLTNPFGRVRTFLGQRNDELWNEAYSYIPQSTVPTIINNRGLLPTFHADTPFSIRNQVHDSLVLSAPFPRTLYQLQTYHNIWCDLKKSLEEPIYIKGQPLVIPAEFAVAWSCGDETAFDPREDCRPALAALYSNAPDWWRASVGGVEWLG